MRSGLLVANLQQHERALDHDPTIVTLVSAGRDLPATRVPVEHATFIRRMVADGVPLIAATVAELEALHGIEPSGSGAKLNGPLVDIFGASMRLQVEVAAAAADAVQSAVNDDAPPLRPADEPLRIKALDDGTDRPPPRDPSVDARVLVAAPGAPQFLPASSGRAA